MSPIINKIRSNQNHPDYSVRFDTSYEDAARAAFDKLDKDDQIELIREWVGDQAITNVLVTEYKVDFVPVEQAVQNMIDRKQHTELFQMCQKILDENVIHEVLTEVFDAQIDYYVIRVEF